MSESSSLFVFRNFIMYPIIIIVTYCPHLLNWCVKRFFKFLHKNSFSLFNCRWCNSSADTFIASFIHWTENSEHIMLVQQCSKDNFELFFALMWNENGGFICRSLIEPNGSSIQYEASVRAEYIWTSMILWFNEINLNFYIIFELRNYEKGSSSGINSVPIHWVFFWIYY